MLFRSLIELAAEAWMVVEIAYVAGDGERTTREIEPVIVEGTGVDAWCRLRHDERHFIFSRIRSARATGEQYTDGESQADALLDRKYRGVFGGAFGDDLDDEEDLLDLR